MGASFEDGKDGKMMGMILRHMVASERSLCLGHWGNGVRAIPALLFLASYFFFANAVEFFERPFMDF